MGAIAKDNKEYAPETDPNTVEQEADQPTQLFGDEEVEQALMQHAEADDDLAAQFSDEEKNLDSSEVDEICKETTRGLSLQGQEYLKEFNELAEKVMGHDLPIAERKAILFEFSRQALQSAKSIVDPIPESIPKKMRYPTDNPDADPYEWLSKHYSKWLKHFTPELDRDYLFQPHLSKLDPGLLAALRSRRKSIKTKTKRELSKIISPQTCLSLTYVEHLIESEQEDLYLALDTNKRNPKLQHS